MCGEVQAKINRAVCICGHKHRTELSQKDIKPRMPKA